jgi:uncharacterized protein YbbC (DUF1343 family)
MSYIYQTLAGLSFFSIVQLAECNPKIQQVSVPAIATQKSTVLDSVVQAQTSKTVAKTAELVTLKPQKIAKKGVSKNGFLNYNLTTGAENIFAYNDELVGQRVGLVVNQTSLIGQRHLVDSLLKNGTNIVQIFSPEHGFRGKSEAGEEISSSSDVRTGIPIVSLYGKKHRPSAEEMAKIDVLIFDIQDVGARFYTYLTTLYYVMEECARYDKRLILLDRPNPNGHYVDGPVLQPSEKSFVGALPIPIVHGCTLGEIALMINGEGWLNTGGKRCALTIVSCDNYTHTTEYTLPIKPSPNLPNNKAIYMYPTLCLFEGTHFSVGRGTDMPFQCYGHPDNVVGSVGFMPMPTESNRTPLLAGRTCVGESFAGLDENAIRQKFNKIDLEYLIKAYQNYPNKAQFFRHDGFFNNLVGNTAVRRMIEEGKTATEITASWQEDIAKYKAIRKKYLLYSDFE